MKVRLLTSEPATGLFVVSRLMEMEEMEAFAGRAKANAAELVAKREQGVMARLFGGKKARPKMKRR